MTGFELSNPAHSFPARSGHLLQPTCVCKGQRGTDVTARHKDHRAGSRILFTGIVVLSVIHMPLPQADFHNVRHHDGPGEVCVHHDHLLRWHPSAGTSADLRSLALALVPAAARDRPIRIKRPDDDHHRPGSGPAPACSRRRWSRARRLAGRAGHRAGGLMAIDRSTSDRHLLREMHTISSPPSRSVGPPGGLFGRAGSCRAAPCRGFRPSSALELLSVRRLARPFPGSD